MPRLFGDLNFGDGFFGDEPIPPIVTGAGNGGETFHLKLAPNGTSETATLASSMTAVTGTINLTGDSGLPTTGTFALTIDDEVVCVRPLGSGVYQATHRGLSNTPAVAHTAGADAVWDDTYDMAIESQVPAEATVFSEADSTSYPGWVFAFDSSQAYLAGDLYPAHIEQLLGMFPPEAGDTGSKLDGPVLSVINVPEGVTDDCPAGLTEAARIVTDLEAGDVGLCRYVNQEASILDLGDRSAGLQVWYALKRVDDSDNDVSLDPPDPTYQVVDTGPVHAEFVDTAFITTTLLGDDRTFTYGPPRFSEKGWPIALLAVRQDNRRVPHWTSPTWHDFSYVYSGFHSGATFCQIMINRNGIVYGPTPSVDLPHPNDIDGPDATLDEFVGYHVSTVWGVYIFQGVFQIAGPILNPPGTGGTGDQPPPTIIPGATFPGGGGTGGTVTPADEDLITEGGSGGGFQPPEADTGGEDIRVYII